MKILTKISIAICAALFVMSMQAQNGNHAANAACYFGQGDRQGVSTPYGNNTAIGKYIQTDDIKMWCEVYGEGAPLFVLHGGGVGDPYELGQLIDSLRALD